MKIVVIGGTGLIGSKLVTELAGSGHEAVAASPGALGNAMPVLSWRLQSVRG